VQSFNFTWGKMFEPSFIDKLPFQNFYKKVTGTKKK
jgi:hypothetical protein